MAAVAVCCVQAAFLELLAAEGEEAWAAAERALAPVLRQKAELAAEATAVAKAKGAWAASGAELSNESCLLAAQCQPQLALAQNSRGYRLLILPMW